MRSCHAGRILAQQLCWLPLEYQGKRYKKEIQKSIKAKKNFETLILQQFIHIYRIATVVFTCFKTKGSKIISRGSDTKFFRGLRHLENKVALTSFVQRWQWYCELSKSCHPLSSQYLNS